MRQVTVLIVDDHEAAREALAENLAKQPDFLLVGCTSDPQVANELAWFWEPDVILIDIRRLGGNLRPWHDMARASPGSRLVVLTSYWRPGDDEICRSLGASRRLFKSIGLASLLQELRSVAAELLPH